MTPADLRALRRAFGLSQEGLGKTLGVSRATICRWEMSNARYPIPEPILKLLHLLQEKARTV